MITLMISFQLYHLQLLPSFVQELPLLLEMEGSQKGFEIFFSVNGKCKSFGSIFYAVRKCDTKTAFWIINSILKSYSTRAVGYLSVIALKTDLCDNG